MKRYYLLSAIAVFALPFVHPFGPVRQQTSPDLLPGVQWDDPQILKVFERSCQNCHSERTQWPAYSYIPGVSWSLEKDVAAARHELNMSHWNDYSKPEKDQLLARIGAEVRSHQMPLGRYLLLHPEARLSEQEVDAIYAWTKSQRRLLRTSDH